MTEADEFIEKTAQNAEEPVLMPVSDTQECLVMEKEDDETFFDEEYADGVPLFQPRTKEEAIRRLKQAGQQFENGQWHTLDEVVAMMRCSISQQTMVEDSLTRAFDELYFGKVHHDARKLFKE